MLRASLVLVIVAFGCQRGDRFVTGRVVDRDDRAIPGAIVSVGAATQAIGRDGSFRIACPVDAIVVVRAPAHATRRIEIRGGGELGRITPSPMRTIDAIVVDERGAPVANARGRVSAPAPLGEGGRDLAEAMTDARGHLTVIAAPARDATLAIEAAGYAELEVELDDGDDAGTLRLVPASPVAGKVVRAGTPVAGAWVAAGTERVQSGPDGRFTLAGAAGRSRIEARRGDALAVATLDGREPLELALVRGARLAGEVIDRTTRAPLRGAWIRLVRTSSRGGVTVGVRELGGLVADETVTRGDGSFALRPLRRGSARAIVARPGYAPRSVPVTLVAGQTARVRVELEPLVDITARVVDTRGEPVAGADVELPAVAGMDPVTTTTTSNGQLALALPPGTPVRVIVRTAELRGEATITAGDATAIVLHPAAHLGGRVVDAAGAPIAGARISVSGAPPIRSGSGGELALGGLPPGPATMTIERRGYATATLALELHAGHADLAPIVLRPSAPLRGVVTRRGRPAARAVVFAQSGGRQTSAVTSADGSFVVEGFAAGDRVALVAVTTGARSSRVEARAGGAITLALDTTSS